MHRAAYAVVRCLYVYSSRSCIETSEHIRKRFSLSAWHGSPAILVFFRTKCYGNVMTGPPPTEASNAGLLWKNSDFRAISLFSSEMIVDRAYNCRLIGSCIWSIDRCHFQWPLLAPDREFKGTSLLEVKYLNRNSYAIYLMVPLLTTLSDPVT